MTSPLPSPLRVLFIGRFDWANLAHRIAAAMNTTAGTTVAHVYVENRHPFGYTEDWVRGEVDEKVVEAWARQCDWIIDAIGQDRFFLGLVRQWKARAQLAVMHPGSQYRAAPSRADSLDRAWGIRRRFVGSDLWRFVRLDDRVSWTVPYYAVPSAIVDDLPPIDDGPIVIAHSPSNRATKGTSTILPVLDNFRRRTDVEVDVIEDVPFDECLRRRARAHILVDQLEPSIGGFGAAAVEAMAAGTAVLADVRHSTAGLASGVHFDHPPVVHCGTAGALRAELDRLVSDRQVLQAQRLWSLEWAAKWTSPSAVASYWWLHLRGRGP